MENNKIKITRTYKNGNEPQHIFFHFFIFFPSLCKFFFFLNFCYLYSHFFYFFVIMLFFYFFSFQQVTRKWNDENKGTFIKQYKSHTLVWKITVELRSSIVKIISLLLCQTIFYKLQTKHTSNERHISKQFQNWHHMIQHISTPRNTKTELHALDITDTRIAWKTERIKGGKSTAGQNISLHLKTKTPFFSAKSNYYNKIR